MDDNEEQIGILQSDLLENAKLDVQSFINHKTKVKNEQDGSFQGVLENIKSYEYEKHIEQFYGSGQIHEMVLDSLKQKVLEINQIPTDTPGVSYAEVSKYLKLRHEILKDKDID